MKKDKEWAKGQLEYYIKAVGNPFNSRTQSMINAYKNVEHIINQLDEPEKPVIPKIVADYIEKWKHEGMTMSEWLYLRYGNEEEDEISKWLYNNNHEENTRREYLLIDAIRYGYEVEKEQRWVIEKGGNYIKTYLIDSNKVVNIDYEPEKEDSLTFLSREEAEAIALLVGGEVEEVTK